MHAERQREEVDRNYDAFTRQLSQLMSEHFGDYALMRDGEVVGFFTKPAEAYREGLARFADRYFSIQQVTDQPIDLGFFSHAAT